MRRLFGAEADNALKIMQCESHGVPSVVNDSPATGDYSIGLFQINILGDLAKNRPSEAWLKVPANNIAYAAAMQKAEGWKPWGCKYVLAN